MSGRIIMDERREFIGLLGGAATWQVAARAQHLDQVRLGVLMTITEDDPKAQSRLATFRARLEQLGWMDGRNVQIDVRFTGADPDRIRNSAAGLVELAPDVILANATTALALIDSGTSPLDHCSCGATQTASGL